MSDNLTRERIVLVVFGFLIGTMISSILFVWALTLETVTMGLGRPF